MQDTQGITFLPSAPVTVAGLLVVVVTGVLGWLAWKRSGYRATIGGLELLRLLLVGLIAGTLCQPEWLRTQPPDQRPSLVVLWDESNSMQTRDVVEGDGTSEEPASRAEAMAPLLRNDAWQAADANLDLVFEPFSSPLDPPVEGTDLNAALARVLEAHANLRGVVVLSDGDWNVGKPPVEAATRFRMKGVPVFAVGVGSPTPLPDLEMASMDTPTFGVAEKPLRIPFVVRSTLGQDRDVTVT
ncbi:MAG: VWA domain-containing protein, partial [Verrucomicrobiae bacterium]|nr:VWA domain-containing protein [Verrucomicrobiae bacterium]